MPKKVIAFMGSPRKNGNTSKLVEEALRGSEEAGAEIKLIRVGDLTMKGCLGCYSCKMKNPPENRCVQKDDMSALYQDIEEADGVIFASPVYFGTMTGQLKLVIDRLFPYIGVGYKSPLPKGKKCGLVFTQNQKDPSLFRNHFDMTAMLLNVIGFSRPEILLSLDNINYFGPVEKLAVQDPEKTTSRKKVQYETVFPEDMKKAYEMGKGLIA